MPRFIFIPSEATTPSIYDGATGAFSLRKFFGWNKGVLRLRRSSDNGTATVFFDGASSQETITLSSYISTVSNTSPSTTTLGTWLGSDTCYVDTWYFQTPSLIIDIAPTQATLSSQPVFATSGVLELDGSEIAVKFSQDFLVDVSPLSALNYDDEFTVLTVSSNTTNNNWSGIFGNYSSTSNGWFVHNSRTTGRRIVTQRGASAGTEYYIQYLTQQNTSDKKLLVGVHDSTVNKAYYNGVFQESEAHNAEVYGNNDVVLGTFKTSFAKLTGYMQEVIVFPSDKTSDLSALNSDINSYYSIY